MIAQIIVVVLIGMDLGMDLVNHGQPKKESNHNFWTTLMAKVVFTAILYWGGFFDAWIH